MGLTDRVRLIDISVHVAWWTILSNLTFVIFLVGGMGVEHDDDDYYYYIIIIIFFIINNNNNNICCCCPGVSFLFVSIFS